MAWTVQANIRGPQGIQGPVGPPGPVGPATFTPRGNYDPATQYVTGDVVQWSGSSYYALDPAPTAGTAPTNGGVDDTFTNDGWAFLAVEGAQGPQGIQGDIGPAGRDGAAGPQGVRGSRWFVGSGAPTVANTMGSQAHDQYLDADTGDVYTLGG